MSTFAGWIAAGVPYGQAMRDAGQLDVGDNLLRLCAWLDGVIYRPRHAR